MADAPSFSTSTRSIAAVGMELRSTPDAPPGEAKLAMRRPLSRISVDDTPMPRKLAPEKPRCPAMSEKLAPSVRAAALAEILVSNSAALVEPPRMMSSRVMTCTGNAVSPSMRLIDDPVISIFSTLCGTGGVSVVWACAPTVVNARRAAATANAQGVAGEGACGIN